MNDTKPALDHLLDALELLERDATRSPDAIDRILAGPPRRTAVRDLRDDPTVQRFRDDLTNGLIRIDTANAVLRLVAATLTMLRGAS